MQYLNIHKKALSFFLRFIGITLIASGVLLLVYLCIPVHLESVINVTSLKIDDRNGILLREVFSPAAGRGTPLRYDEISPDYLKVLIVCEDSRYFKHHGVDFRAIARALKENFRHGKTISGASTITQQLVKNIRGYKKRTIFNKTTESIEAIRVDLHCNKEEILEQYCNRIPFGNNNFGIEAASQFYFGKSARNLTLSEAVYLVTIPKNPSLYNPFGKGLATTGSRYKSTLEKLLARKAIDSSEYLISSVNFPALKIRTSTIKAPHFTNWVLSQVTPDLLTEINTSLDYHLQTDLESIIDTWLSKCAPYHVTNAASIVIKNSTGEILAYAGSKDFWNEQIQGQVDGVRSLRQPGSSIKPFTYALALSKNFTPSTILADIPGHFMTAGGDFKPLNYDKKYHGPVRLRVALGCSYNIPVVRVAEELGVDNLLDFYHEFGFLSLKRSARDYGLGLTLGNGEITLLELAQAGQTIARSGTAMPLRPIIYTKGLEKHIAMTAPAPKRIISEEVSFLISDILSDHDARAPAFGSFSALDLPFRCSVKTGTSKDYKDNWTIGWTDSFTVAVWVGNFDGTPMQNVSGVSGAAPIFHETMVALEKKFLVNNPSRQIPSGIIKTPVCVLSGDKPGPFCKALIDEYFVKGKEVSAVCTYHTINGIAFPPIYKDWTVHKNVTLAFSQSYSNTPLKILFPENGAIFKIDPDLEREYQTITFKTQIPSNTKALGVIIDGKQVDTVESQISYRWTIQEGKHRIRMFDINDPRINDEVGISILP